MSKNPLKYNASDADAIYALRQSGADLSNYQDQLSRERSSRTLTLRRTNRPLISCVQTRSTPLSPHRINRIDTASYPFLDPGYVRHVFQTGDENSALDLLKNMEDVYNINPKLLQSLISSESISESINKLLNSLKSIGSIGIVLHYIAVIYPKCGMNQERLIDDGLVFSLISYFESNDHYLIECSINLIGVLSENSAYARDSIICLGLHFDLIQIAQQERTESLTEMSCNSLSQIFAHTDKIDSTSLNSVIEPLAPLLFLTNHTAVRSIINCFVSITNQKPALVFRLFELGLFPQIVEFMKFEYLLPSVLPLMGNLSVSQVAHIKLLIENDLLQILKGYIKSPYTPEVFWIFSNLVESVPHVMLNFFDFSMIDTAMSFAMNGNVDEKREATFFVSTVIIFSSSESLNLFLCPEVAEIIETMFECGIVLIILRCLDAALKLFHYAHNTKQGSLFIESMLKQEIIDSLVSLSRNGSSFVSDRSEYLLALLEKSQCL